MSKNFCDLSGKVALITGASRGIGAACAAELASAGAKVMLTDIDGEQCKATSDALNEQGYDTRSLQHDVCDESRWPEVVQTCIESCGGFDVLVNNAGIYIGGLLVNNSTDELRQLNKVNVESVFLGMKYASDAMKPNGAAGKGGSIINLSSIAGLMGVPGHSAYGSTKGSVRLYTKHAAVEFARLGLGVRVNSVHPGVIETAMGQQVFDDFIEIGMAADNDDAREKVLQLIPTGTFGQSQDIANMVRFLAADESAYCTGAEFVVDGGAAAG